MEAVAPWAGGLLLASPVLLAFYPPMSDLPYHEGAIGILRHFRDPAMFPPGLYQRNLGEPNQLFHFLGWGLSYVVSTRWAVKLLVAAGVVAVPVCAARFARYVGASPIAAIAVAPMTLGWLFSWGLVANLLGLGAFLFVLPALDRFALTPTPGRAVRVCAGLLTLYLAHEAMMFLYAGMALALAAAHPWSWRKTSWRLLPLFFGIALTLAHLKLQAPFVTPLLRAIPRLWHPLSFKLGQVPYMIFPAHEGLVQLAISALCLLAIGSFFWLRARERGASTVARGPRLEGLERVRAHALAYRWELFALACFAAYLAFPETLNGATMIYERWFAPGYAILVVVAAPRDLWRRPARVPLIGLGALPLATLFVAFPAFAESSQEYQELEAILPAIHPGSAVVEINLGADEASRTYTLGPAAGRVLATRGGRLAFAFTDSSISPAVIPRRYQWTESLVRLGFDSWQLRPAHDLKRFEYVLLRTTDRSIVRLTAWALQSEAEYVTESGGWVLFRSRLPVVPLLSRDVPLEKPPPENLRDRFARLLAELQKGPRGAGPPKP